jgi:cysteine-rich repeat protein
MKQLLGVLGFLSVACGAVCGDEKVEEAEACDDGNNLDADGCEADCSLPACGNGIIDPGELCFVLQSFSSSDGVNGIGPNGVALADLNGDNLLDMATANGVTNDVSLLTNLGNGTFSAPQFLPTTGLVPSVLRTAQLQVGNNIPDLICVNENSNDVSVFFDGLAGPSLFGVGTSPRDLEIGDLEGDGSQDVVALNVVGDSVSVLRNVNGNGIFAAAVEIPVGNAPDNLTLGDVDGDQNLDLLVSGGVLDITLFFGVGDGTFEAPLLLPLAGLNAEDHVITDLNEDSFPDILFAANIGELRIFLGAGNRQFNLSPQSFPLAIGARSLRLQDLNNDGLADAVVSSSGAGEEVVSILLGQGAGAFAPRVDFVVPPPGDVEVGDLNNDSLPDVVIPDGFGNQVQVLLSDP